MDFKPTFYSVVGFIVPGALAILSCYLLLPAAWVSWALDAADRPGSGNDLVYGSLLLTSLLAVALFVGSVLSETFQLLLRFAVRRPFTGDAIHDYAALSLERNNLFELLRNDLDAREAYTYMRTCGIDLHWFAGRVRMIGAGSLAIGVVALVGLCQSANKVPNIVGAVLALIGLAIAVYRSVRFDNYVAVLAAVAYHSGESQRQDSEEL